MTLLSLILYDIEGDGQQRDVSTGVVTARVRKRFAATIGSQGVRGAVR